MIFLLVALWCIYLLHWLLLLFYLQYNYIYYYLWYYYFNITVILCIYQYTNIFFIFLIFLCFYIFYISNIPILQYFLHFWYIYISNPCYLHSTYFYTVKFSTNTQIFQKYSIGVKLQNLKCNTLATTRLL